MSSTPNPATLAEPARIIPGDDWYASLETSLSSGQPVISKYARVVAWTVERDDSGQPALRGWIAGERPVPLDGVGAATNGRWGFTGLSHLLPAQVADLKRQGRTFGWSWA